MKEIEFEKMASKIHRIIKKINDIYQKTNLPTEERTGISVVLECNFPIIPDEELDLDCYPVEIKALGIPIFKVDCDFMSMTDGEILKEIQKELNDIIIGFQEVEFATDTASDFERK